MNEESDSENNSIPKPEPSKGGSGKPPRPTAVGTGGSGDEGDFNLGQRVNCKIVSKTDSGYSVVTEKAKLPGFFVTTKPYQDGQSVTLKFIKWDGESIIFAEPSNKPDFWVDELSTNWTKDELDIGILLILKAAKDKRPERGGANPKLLMDCLDTSDVESIEHCLWTLKEKGYIVMLERLFQITEEGKEYLLSQTK